MNDDGGGGGGGLFSEVLSTSSRIASNGGLINE
jgi:hypothetical protein